MLARRSTVCRLRCMVSHAALLISFCTGLVSYSAAQASVTTWHNNRGRTGNNLLETILTPSNVNEDTFGRLFSQPVDGFIYAQPLYVPNVGVAGLGMHNVVYVETMNDSAYAFDADSNEGGDANPLWKVSFINPAAGITTVPASAVGCSNFITTQIGVVGTPVIDTTIGTMFLIVRTLENGTYFQRLHALDITSGAEKFGGPVVIQASVKGTGLGSVGGTISFDPLVQNQHSALLLQNGMVYIAWGSQCDLGNYHGWLMAYNESSLTQAGAWMTTPNAQKGAIWGAGAGPAGDSASNIYFAVANGSFDAQKRGTDFGQSLMKLAPPDEGEFKVLDYFTPYDGPSLNIGDWDIGSGGLILLPDQTTGPVLHLLVQSDKKGDIFLVNRDNMGHYNSQNNNQIVQYLPAADTGMWSSPAYWNYNVYFGGSGDHIKSFSLNPTTGLLSTTPVSQSPGKFAYPGTTPAISANQSRDAILWALDTGTYQSTTSGAVLNAYDATNLATSIYSSNQDSTRDNPGAAVKFQIPVVVNGKVYVGTQTQLSVYGLLSGNSAATKPAKP